MAQDEFQVARFWFRVSCCRKTRNLKHEIWNLPNSRHVVYRGSILAVSSHVKNTSRNSCLA